LIGITKTPLLFIKSLPIKIANSLFNFCEIIVTVSSTIYSLIIKLVLNFRESFASASRKMKKVYFYNSSFLYNYKNIMDYNYYGKLIENFVMQELDAKYYFRYKNYEIDFILKNGNIIPVEVKYRNNVETKNFIKALKKLNLNYGVIISKDEFRDEIIDNIKVKILPVWYLPLINIKNLK
jgi:hypothetical protein